MAGLLEGILTSPVGRKVAAKAGLAEPPRLRRGRVLPAGPVALASLPGGGIAAEVLDAVGVSPGEPRRDLPGNPDVVLPRYRTVILVHGCFWHHHEGCLMV